MVVRSQRVADRLNQIMGGGSGQPAPPTDNAEKTSKASVWREGSGTSVHNPKPVPKPPARPAFSEGEEEVIKSYMRSGKTRTEAEQLVKDMRGPENKVTWVRPNAPNQDGTTRGPDWKNPGPGKKRP